jgi:hypothetical protein
MQAGDALPPWREKACRFLWATHSYMSGIIAWGIHKFGAHKQYANRLIEPTGHISVVMTATDLANFFALRWHPDAQPEICELARKMYLMYQMSTPKTILCNFWHLPFVTDEEIAAHFAAMGEAAVGSTSMERWLPLIKLSVARCARVSFLNHEGKKPSQDEDFKLYDRLLAEQPIHASPAEHQAMPLLGKDGTSGNFRGWLQFRKHIPNENIMVFSGPLKPFR